MTPPRKSYDLALPGGGRRVRVVDRIPSDRLGPPLHLVRHRCETCREWFWSIRYEDDLCGICARGGNPYDFRRSTP